GVSAFVMSIAMPAIGGVTQAAATTIFSVYFLFALAKAYRHILRREFALHREWMIRAFAIGLAVTTIRPIIGVTVGITIATRGLPPLSTSTLSLGRPSGLAFCSTRSLLNCGFVPRERSRRLSRRAEYFTSVKCNVETSRLPMCPGESAKPILAMQTFSL